MTDIRPDGVRTVHLGAFYPNDHHHTLWGHPQAGSQIEFGAFEQFARSAERGLFDFVFLAEANWLQEHRDRVIEHAILDKPDSLTLLAALAAETSRIGLVATIGTTFADAFHVARQFAALQRVSNGRAGWNVVTSHTSFGQGATTNFRPGRLGRHEDRYTDAERFVQDVLSYWDPARAIGSAPFAVPDERPVIVQAGGSEAGRDLAGRYADAVFAGRRSIELSREFADDIRGRSHSYGNPEALILPSTAFVLGDTEAEAQERQREWRDLEMTPKVAAFLLEEVWGGDLSDFDVDGPLPSFDPDWDHAYAYTRGMVGGERDARTLVAGWRHLAETEHFSVRQLLSTVRARRDFVGTGRSVALQINEWVQAGAADGFVVNPSVVPSGLDDFVDAVVPELQELGVFRTEYTGNSLRDHLTQTVQGRTAHGSAGARA